MKSGMLVNLAMILGIGFLTAPAGAHPRIVATSFASGVTATSPFRLTFRFSEPLIARFSKVVANDAHGRLVAMQPSMLSADHKQLSVVSVHPFAPGAYSIAWRAVSIDTHHVEGVTRFVVR